MDCKCHTPSLDRQSEKLSRWPRELAERIPDAWRSFARLTLPVEHVISDRLFNSSDSSPPRESRSRGHDNRSMLEVQCLIVVSSHEQVSAAGHLSAVTVSLGVILCDSPYQGSLHIGSVIDISRTAYSTVIGIRASGRI